jgi:D-3-phosphoglycerate dehydrogenase
MDCVLVNKPIHPDALAHLRAQVDTLTPYTVADNQVLDILKQADAIILSGSLKIGAQEMDQLPKLKVVGRHGVGLDTVDLDAASERRLPVVYTPYGPTESTAEHALLLIMATARRLAQLDQAMRKGNFNIRSDLSAMGRELRGKSLGIVGFGRIGQRVAEMCRAALEMPIYVFDPYVDRDQVIAWGATYIEDLVDLAGRVDIISIHAPSIPETHHLISRQVIQAMKCDAILVNASRGALVDEGALIEALENHSIGGAGLDVYDPEPPSPDNPLFQFDQVIVTPHIGSFTEEARRLMGMTVAQDVLSVLRGEPPQYLANPQIWQTRKGL